MTSLQSKPKRVAVIGGGPAGLMAAEVLVAGGAQVDRFDVMPSVGRKFLLAGKGGLNLTHGEELESLLGRYGSSRAQLEPMIRSFGPIEMRAWAQDLGVSTFIGSSGRVFPTDLKAAPLLRAWLHRLRTQGVSFHMRHRWLGWESSNSDTQVLRFAREDGEITVEANAIVLALGGGSWSRLGSDGRWVALLAAKGVDVAPLRPSNCGFDVARVAGGGAIEPGWSEFFRTKFAGHPMKNVALSMRAHPAVAASVDETEDTSDSAAEFEQAGEFVITEGGVEGSLVYAASAFARDTIAAHGSCVMHIDLLPTRSAEFVREEVARPRGSRSLSTHLKSRLGIDGVKAALLHELLSRELIADATRLAKAIKSLPLTLLSARPIDEAISSAGGVKFEALDESLMLRAVPGVFCSGEMLDWEAPTGGYLLTACFASGVAAAHGALSFVKPTTATVENTSA
jgi:uncharacterized flavoprotein (TIGR03862 family)